MLTRKIAGTLALMLGAAVAAPLLVEVGVDHVNTDDLDGLQRFLTR